MKSPSALSRRDFLGTQAAAVAGLVAVRSTWSADNPAASRRGQRGVTIAAAEFGATTPTFCNESPGTYGRDYTYNSEQTTAYFCARRLGLLRIPFCWERIQPRLGEALNAAELDRLKGAVEWARHAQGSVILDVHNYGRYVVRRGGKPCPCIIDQPIDGKVIVSREHFADLWRRLSQAFRDDSTIAAYGLMNEPHHMASSDWKAISQIAVDAIRAGNDQHWILVAGDDWSNAPRFAKINGPKAWINDPIGRTAYEAHCYFDKDFSGRYKQTYDVELAADPRLEFRGIERLQPFVDWCRNNQVRGILGEFGVPGKDARWLKVLDHFLIALDKSGMDGCYWAAGEWWHDYPLSVQPQDDYRRPAPQEAILTR